MIRIVTDTDSNLTLEQAAQWGIEMAPIHVIFGEEVLRETYEIGAAESYARIAGAKELPKTSQPPVGEFSTIYQRILDEDPSATILTIVVSGGVSGTVESARQAAALLPGADIRVFDTRSVSAGQALMAVHAARLARTGLDADTILAHLGTMRDHAQVYFAVNTLEYLVKGGRIGRASYLMAGLLDIKPILFLEDGVINAHSRHRTWKRAVAALREFILQAGQGERPEDMALHLGVAHADSEAEARGLYDALVEALQPDETLFCDVGPGLGIHTGPGALGACWTLAPRL